MSARTAEHRRFTALRPASMVELVSSADLPTRFGMFRILGFQDQTGDEYATLVRGELEGARDVPVRLHSQCLTGDALGSLRCDCRDQLEEALRILGASERGVLIYLPQEGRGIGLGNKLRAYHLQDQGYDTVDANLALGFPSDLRRYDPAAGILRHLGVVSVEILTNNPEKVEALERNGIIVSRRTPIVIPPNPHNARYLDTKRTRCGHLL